MEQGLIDIDSLKVASPCSARWADMAGDERARQCALCKKNVYNVEGMALDEVRALIKGSETMPCLRLRRRKDGTVITSDCPVGRQAVWRRAAVAGLCGVFVLLSGLGMAKGIATAEPNYDEPKTLEELARGTPIIGELIEKISPSPSYTVGNMVEVISCPPFPQVSPSSNGHVGMP